MDRNANSSRVALDLDRRWFPYATQLLRPGHRLLCIHHAGGSAATFRAWTRPLGDAGIEVLAAQLPGRETRRKEPAFRDFSEAVEALTQAFIPVLGLPYTLLGHSLGAKLAFAVAGELQRMGAPPPQQLVLSAARAPEFHRELGLAHAALPRDQLVKTLKDLGGTPSALFAHPEYLELFLPLFRADLSLNAGAGDWTARILDTPLQVWGGTSDTMVRRERLEPWLSWTRAGGEIRLFPGGHFYLLEGANRIPDRLVRLAR